MTDHNREEREALIEAFKSRASEWDAYDFDPNWDYSTEAGILADIVLAVFEQAHTPTSDEREALRRVREFATKLHERKGRDMASDATIKSVWQEAHPLSMWRYDYPDREMSWWEMPAFRMLSVVRRLTTRFVVIWHLLTTGPNTPTLAPWEAGGWRRVRAILALLLPLPIRWHYPHYPDSADGVLIWWSSDIGSTPSGLSWRAFYVGVGYGKNWRAYIYEDGE